MRGAKFRATLIALSLLLVSCGTIIPVSKEKVNFAWPKTDSFTLSHIEVNDFSKVKMWPYGFVTLPSQYEIIKSATCSSLKGSDYKPKRKIYFNRNNKGYSWQYTIETDSIKTDICPIKISEDNWYMISGLQEYSVLGERHIIYLNYTRAGKFKDYHIKLNYPQDENL